MYLLNIRTEVFVSTNKSMSIFDLMWKPPPVQIVELFSAGAIKTY